MKTPRTPDPLHRWETLPDGEHKRCECGATSFRTDDGGWLVVTPFRSTRCQLGREPQSEAARA